jgi:hypothetical protein
MRTAGLVACCESVCLPSAEIRCEGSEEKGEERARSKAASDSCLNSTAESSRPEKAS